MKRQETQLPSLSPHPEAVPRSDIIESKNWWLAAPAAPAIIAQAPRPCHCCLAFCCKRPQRSGAGRAARRSASNSGSATWAKARM